MKEILCNFLAQMLQYRFKNEDFFYQWKVEKAEPEAVLGQSKETAQVIYLVFLAKSYIYYIPSTPNNSNETYTFMCPGRAGRFGQH